jgi:stage IV sporulation protein A
MSDLSGIDIKTDKDLISTVSTLAEVKGRYEKVEKALADVEEKGYGIVMPSPDELKLEEPRLVRSAGGYGVKVSANAESIHMIKAKIKTEFSPVVGTEDQSEEVVKYLVSEYEEDPKKLWECNMFGRSLYDMLRDGLDAKLLNIPDESREKLGETLEKILNDGANGLICILL